MIGLNTVQTIFFGFVVLGLIALAAWTAMPDRPKKKAGTSAKPQGSDGKDRCC